MVQLTVMLHYIPGHSSGDTVTCCIMEARQDGTVAVSISPKLLEDLSKVKKKKRKSSTGSSGISNQRKLQLAEVNCMSYHVIYNVCTLYGEFVTVPYSLYKHTVLSSHLYW